MGVGGGGGAKPGVRTCVCSVCFISEMILVVCRSQHSCFVVDIKN